MDMVSQDMRNVITFPDKTTAYMLIIKRLNRNPRTPLFAMPFVYPTE
jgi:hypothetical protein